MKKPQGLVGSYVAATGYAIGKPYKMPGRRPDAIDDLLAQSEQHRRAMRARDQFINARALADDVITQLSFLTGADASTLQRRVSDAVRAMRDLERSLEDAVERRIPKKPRRQKRKAKAS